ncbi:MAG: ABC transporter substrate-binding protein [Clostridia bacterium]
MKKYIILSIILFVLIIASIFGIVYLKNNEKVQDVKVLKVNEVTRSVFYAPQYVAISKGFFENNNLKIELTTGQGADKVMTSVLSGGCDIGFAGPEASIYVYNEGKEDYTEVFAQLTKKDGSFLVSKTNENFSFNNLKGKTVIPGRKGGVPYMTFEYTLRKNGINPKKDLILDDSIKFDLMAGAFTGGKADYVTLFEPTASLIQNSGKGYIVASIGKESGEIPYTAYFAKKSYIQNNKETIQKFVDSVYKGQLWVKEHSSKEIATCIIDFFPDTNLELLETVIQRYKDIDVWSDSPVLKESSFELLQTVMEQAGELKQKAPYNKVVNNEFSEKVK